MYLYCHNYLFGQSPHLSCFIYLENQKVILIVILFLAMAMAMARLKLSTIIIFIAR